MTDEIIHLLDKITTPGNSDVFPLDYDVLGTPITKGITWANIKATLKAYNDTLYNLYVHPNHIGDVTSVADGAQTIAAKAVTLAKMADMATVSLIGRNTAGAGVPEILSKATALSLLNVANGADVTGSNAPQAHKSTHQNGGGDEISVAGLSGLLADDQHVLDVEVLAVAAAKGANADITSMTALTQIGNSAGDLKIQSDVQGDVVFFEDTDVGDTENGKAVYIHRKAAGGDGYGKQYINQYRKYVFEFHGTDIIFDAYDGKIMQFAQNASDGTIFEFGSQNSGVNVPFRYKGWLTAPGATKYVEYKIDDISDNFILTRQDNNIGYFDIQMPTVITGGNVGMGTTIPGNPLAVNRAADGIIVDFESADVVEGNVSITDNTTSYNAFVGSHYTQLKSDQEELPVGAVVISTGEIIPCEANIEKEIKEEIEVLIENAVEDVEFEENGEQIGEEFDRYELEGEKLVEVKKPIYEKVKKIKKQLKGDHAIDPKTGKIIKTITTKQNVSPNVSGKEYFSYVDITNTSADKRVYGVWLGKMSDDAKNASFGQDDKPVYLITQVGLFKIRVTDTNGNIGIGDYLETSIRPMEAQKQTLTQKENSTIAKAMVSVNWDTEKVDVEIGYKWKLIPCIF